ncbi:hypothetical protein ARALYDRAFT_315636 [Arabidopsis lyrata subsp. lyrata]|uniref:Uncharacterized protein n=1 Tax=Arabidopsis lyrata subsp. lyrata TaxID=81972 RepID=D7KT33_ARALL|nr:hypothetical protein ARALYDRAFT_315636 [Arabidopsis lyrata subsp. lyrata]
MGLNEPCIYRVPSRIRDVKPEAYTPRMVVIGPLHRYPKSTTIDGAETSSYPWHIKPEYSMMEARKKVYFETFSKYGDGIVKMRKIVQGEEKKIRDSYEESTEWIPSEYFVDLILHDALFIMQFLLTTRIGRSYDEILGQESVVRNDLILLENQLPFFILDRLFSSDRSFMTNVMLLHRCPTIKDFILNAFGLTIEENPNFKHFTDMFRYVYEKSLDNIPGHVKLTPWSWPHNIELMNADNLSKGGVKFKVKAMFGVFSLHVEFKKGRLTMLSFRANQWFDMVLRNVIAFEQCHVSLIPFTTNYVHFLNFLITSDRDVEVLSEEGVVTNNIGRVSLVVDMVNKLQVGVKVGNTSQYFYIAEDLRAHCKSRRKRCWATLRKVYFSDLWTGTATLAAAFLLLLTLVGTVASVIQAYKSFK